MEDNIKILAEEDSTTVKTINASISIDTPGNIEITTNSPTNVNVAYSPTAIKFSEESIIEDFISESQTEGRGSKIENLTEAAPKKPTISQYRQIADEILKTYADKDVDERYVLTKALINNQCTFLENQMDSGVDIFPKGSLLLKMVPQIVKRLPLELIGVQPLSSPVGIIYKFDKRESIKDPLNIVSAAVEAYTRKLQSKWTIEAIQDLSSSRCGSDFEQEMVYALATEVAEEITTEIVENLMELAKPQNVVLTDTDSKKERMCKLVNSILDAATLMHARNMRKSANWIVVDPVRFVKIRNGAELIDQKKKEDFPECDAKPTFVGSPNVDYNDNRPLQHVGTLSGSIRVYVSLHMVESKNMLMGYSGTSPSDNGFFYSPYIMLMAPGVIVDPITFQPSMHLMTRYGVHVPDNASDYYTLLEIEE